MASGGVLTHPHDVRSLTMKSDKLTVQGTGITPRANSPAPPLAPTPAPALAPPTVTLTPGPPDTASRSSMTSDDDVTRSMDDEEADSMLQGVVSMNKILEGQIEALRLRLHVEDKHHRDEKNKLRQEKDTVIRTKESEIEDLRESLVNRDERIHNLVRASQEKDKTIQDKVSEIDELKKMVKQTEDYAHKLHRQIGQVKHKKEALETDTLYKEQNAEIGRLGQELQELKKRLGAMEQELGRASKIIQQQTSRIQQLEEERGQVHAKFKDELDKATRAMRQEVERMREVMRQNYEEMRQLREQNRQMHSDVKDIKDMLMKSKGAATPRNQFMGTGIQRPLTASPMNLVPAELNSRSPSPAKGSPLSLRSPSQGVAGALQATRGSGGSGSRPGEVGPRQGLLQQRKPSAMSPGSKPGEPKASPAICGLKEGTGLPTIGRQGSTLQARTKSAAVRLSSSKAVRK